MKNIVTFVLTTVFATVLMTSLAYNAASSLSAEEYEARKEQLLNMTPQECYDFLAANGVDMPDIYDVEYWGTQGMCYIQYTAEGPSFVRILNDGVRAYFALEVGSVVNHYLGIPAPQDEKLEALRSNYLDVDLPKEYATQSTDEQTVSAF